MCDGSRWGPEGVPVAANELKKRAKQGRKREGNRENVQKMNQKTTGNQ
jgi:hypothetical protein